MSWVKVASPNLPTRALPELRLPPILGGREHLARRPGLTDDGIGRGLPCVADRLRRGVARVLAEILADHRARQLAILDETADRRLQRLHARRELTLQAAIDHLRLIIDVDPALAGFPDVAGEQSLQAGDGPSRMRVHALLSIDEGDRVLGDRDLPQPCLLAHDPGSFERSHRVRRARAHLTQQIALHSVVNSLRLAGGFLRNAAFGDKPSQAVCDQTRHLNSLEPRLTAAAAPPGISRSRFAMPDDELRGYPFAPSA